MGRFIGKYDTIPDPTEEDRFRQKLQQNYGFLRDDGLLIICPVNATVNGASIPIWLCGLGLGTPLEAPNCYWACPHDCGYSGQVIIVDTNRGLQTISPQRIMRIWEQLHQDKFVHRNDFDRKWWDENLVMCMESLGEPWMKRKAVYAGVRAGGWRNYKKS